MKILVTGGGGFIGSALLQTIPSTHEVVSLSRGTNYDVLGPKLSKHVKLVKGDITDRELVHRLTASVDIVVHLAGIAGESQCMKNPRLAALSNILGTHVLIDSAIKNGIKRFLFGSSYWAYSFFDKRTMPLDENSDPSPDSFYGVTKIIAEKEIQELLPDRHIILRLSTVFGYGSGVGAQWKGLVGKYIQSAFNGSKLTVFGDGTQQIDLVHIDDVTCVLKHMVEDTSFKHGIYNIGGGRPVSINEIADTVIHLACTHFNIETEVEKKNPPPGKIWPPRWMAIHKIRSVLLEFPRISLEDGILDMMNQYKANAQ